MDTNRVVAAKDTKPNRLFRSPWLIWILAFFISAIAVSVSSFHSESNDSKWYTIQVSRLVEKPASQWIAPKWGENFYGHSPNRYVGDHLVGHLIPGVLLAKLGVPAAHALRILCLGYQILLLLLIVALAKPFISDQFHRAPLWALLLIPPAFTYGLRANHEIPMTFYMVLAIFAGTRLPRSHGYGLLAALAVAMVFLIKGMTFVVVPPMIVVATALSGDPRDWGGWIRGLLWALLSVVAVIAVGFIYESLYHQATGLSFFGEYWRLQIESRSLAVGSESPWLFQKLKNAGYYLSRSFYYAAPWSLLAAFVGFKALKPAGFAEGFAESLRHHLMRPQARLYLIFFASLLIYIGAFSISNRTASRYVFPVYYFASSIAIYYLAERSARFQKIHRWIEARNPHLVAAGLWTLLVLIHLGSYSVRQYFGIQGTHG